MRVEIHNEIPVPPKQCVVLTLTMDEAMHVKRILYQFQGDDKNRHSLTERTRIVKVDLWVQLDRLGIVMAKEATY